MEYKTNHKDTEVTVKPATEEDWRGQFGYEVEIKPRGCQVVYGVKNHPNAAQALQFAKELVDKNEIPRVRKKFLGLF